MTSVTEKNGIVLVLFAAVLWATVGVGARLVPASEGFAPEFLGLARTAIAGPVILLVAFAVLGRRAVFLSRLDPVNLIAFAASNAAFQVGLFRCFNILGVTITVFLTVCLPPIMAMVWNWLRQREPVGFGSVLALGHAAAGLALIAADRRHGTSVMATFDGLLIAVGTSAAFVFMSGAARSLARSAPPLMIAGIGLSLSSAFILLLLSVTGMASFSSLTVGLADPQVMVLILYLGRVPTALAYVCFCTGIARCRSSLVGLIASMIEPAIAAGLAIWILSDEPGAAEAVGCALLMIAMVILWQSERSLARKLIRAGAPPIA